MANSVLLTGRITKDLELKDVGSFKKCDFVLAVDRDFAKEGQQQTDFINITCFNKTAENLCKYQGKGSKILVLGSLNIDQYKKDGENKTFTKVIANKIEFLESKNKNSQNNNSFEPVNDDDDYDLPF